MVYMVNGQESYHRSVSSVNYTSGSWETRSRPFAKILQYCEMRLWKGYPGLEFERPGAVPLLPCRLGTPKSLCRYQFASQVPRIS